MVRLFNAAYAAIFARYSRLLGIVTRRGVIAVALLALVYCGLAWSMRALPSSLVPGEDQKVFLMTMQMPNGASQARSIAVSNAISATLKAGIPEIASIATIGGQNLATGAQSSSVASFVVQLKHWDERTRRGQDAASIILKAQRLARDAFQEPLVMAFNVPTINGLGLSPGLTFELENRGDDQSAAAMASSVATLHTAFTRVPALSFPYTAFSMQGKFVTMDIDRDKAKRQGVSLSNLYDALGTLLGGSYINDFEQFGRTYKVKMQARDAYRASADTLRFFNVRNQDGGLVPSSTFVRARDAAGPEYLTRYNLYPSAEFMAAPAPGYSTGDAMSAMEAAARETLPSGFSFEWSGQSYQERRPRTRLALCSSWPLSAAFLSLPACMKAWPHRSSSCFPRPSP